MKYQKSKIFMMGHQDNSPCWQIATTFAGDPVLMEALESRIRKELVAVKPFPKVEDFEQCLKTAMPEIHANVIQGEPELEVICGITTQDENPKMFYASRTAVVSAGNVRYIGVGDSSLIRYLESKLYHPGLSVTEAILIGVYITAQAKSHILGVGGDTNVAVLWTGGHAELYDAAVTVDIEQDWESLEWNASKVLDVFLARDTYSEEDVLKQVEELSKRLKSLRKVFFEPSDPNDPNL
jgi:hypothetical protein